MGKYILSLDQGTTSSRAILFNKKGESIAIGQREFNQIYPQAGWVEHDPMEIWGSQIGVIKEVMERAGVQASEIAAIGITNQRETTIIWDKNTGKPVYNAIVWQCRRTAQICEDLKNKGWEEYIQNNTGLVIDAYFSATKIKWILDNVTGARERAERGDLLFGTIDSWLIWKLTRGKVHISDYSNASRTMLYNINDLEWDHKIIDALEIPPSILPKIVDSSGICAYTDPELFGGIKIPISGIAGDQQSSLFGQLCFQPGTAKNTYGTGCFLLMNIGEKPLASKNGLLTTIGWGINGKVYYALEGSIFVAGAALQWLRDEIKILESVEDSEAMALKVKDTNGVYLIPAFVGLGAPYWDMYARGTIVGITRGVNKNHIVRAALESIAYQTKDILEAMEQDSGILLQELRVDGGAVNNDFLMQFQSDILNSKVIRPKITESTALGVAYLSGLAVGFWESIEEIQDLNRIDRIFTPGLEVEIGNALYRGWKKAVKRSLNWA